MAGNGRVLIPPGVTYRPEIILDRVQQEQLHGCRARARSKRCERESDCSLL